MKKGAIKRNRSRSTNKKGSQRNKKTDKQEKKAMED